MSDTSDSATEQGRCEERHELPDISLKELEDGQEIECVECGEKFEAAIDEYTGNVHWIPMDIAQPNGLLQHPLAYGLAGMLLAMAAFFIPIGVGVELTEYLVSQVPEGETWALAYALGLVAAFVALGIVELLERFTPLHEWLWKFGQWQDLRGVHR